MKTVLLNIVIAVGALVLLAGCAKDGDGTRPEGKITAITVSAGGFSPAAGVRSGDTAMAANAAAASVATEDVGTVYARASEGSNSMGTRATDEGYITGFDSGDKIGLTVVKSDGTIVHNNIVLTYDGSGWNLPAETDLWFYTGAQYVACYPYDAAMTAVIEAADDKTGTGIAAAIFAAFTPKSDQSAYADYTASDLMLWSGSANTTGVSPKLDIALKHAMAMVIHEPHGAGYTTPAGVAWEWHEAATYSAPSDIAVTVNGTGYIPYAMLDAGNSTTTGVSGAPDGTYRFVVNPARGLTSQGNTGLSGRL